MKCSVYIATSVDGFIATKDGSVDWLHTAGDPNADMGNAADMGFNEFMASIDCIIMGRKCMEVIAAMNLTPEQWPYGDTRIITLSNTLKEAPANLMGNVEMYSGDLEALMQQLELEGHQHAYIDGGTTIQGFLNQKRINEITITRAPIVLGDGIPLFGKTEHNISLKNATAIAFPNGFVQVKYLVEYAQ